MLRLEALLGAYSPTIVPLAVATTASDDAIAFESAGLLTFGSRINRLGLAGRYARLL